MEKITQSIKDELKDYALYKRDIDILPQENQMRETMNDIICNTLSCYQTNITHDDILDNLNFDNQLSIDDLSDIERDCVDYSNQIIESIYA